MTLQTPTELTEQEADKLAELVEHPAWPLFEKYLSVERWATMNNGFIQASSQTEFGYCQGDIGRINKIESDMRAYHSQMLAKAKVDQMKKEHEDIENSYLATYNDDPDFPLST